MLTSNSKTKGSPKFMSKRIVIALGGNALGNTLPEQMVAVKETAKAIGATASKQMHQHGFYLIGGCMGGDDIVGIERIQHTLQALIAQNTTGLFQRNFVFTRVGCHILAENGQI